MAWAADDGPKREEARLALSALKAAQYRFSKAVAGIEHPEKGAVLRTYATAIGESLTAIERQLDR